MSTDTARTASAEPTFRPGREPLASFDDLARGDDRRDLAGGDPGPRLGAAAGALGKGLVAGLIGTAVMTAVQTIEMKVREREPSTVPADAVKKILRIEPRDERAEQRLAQLVHFAYGTAWGGVRGLLGEIGMGRGETRIGPVGGSVAHFFAIWGAAAVILPALDLAPPPTRWSRQEVAIDALHHAVYAAATGAAYAWLDRTGLDGQPR